MQEQFEAIDQLLESGEAKKAEVLIVRSLKLQLSIPDQANLLLRRARVKLLTARPEDALDDLNTARNLLPEIFESPEVLELLADVNFARFELATVGFADRGHVLQAQENYRHIIENYPRYGNLGWVYYQLGRISIVLNQIDSAIDYFQQALLNPSHVSALTAYCYERLGFIAFYEGRDPERALAFVRRAADTYPASKPRAWLVQVHILRSRILRQMRDDQAALKAAETALALVSVAGSEDKLALAEALLTLGELLSGMEGREHEVVSFLGQFLQTGKRPPGVDVTWSRVNEMLGDAYFKLGQFDNAATAYHAALQFNPDHPWEISLRYRIARSYYQQGEYQMTVDVIHKLLEAARADDQAVSDYRVYDLLGSAQFALKHYDRAAEAYRLALEMAPPNADNIDQIRTYLDFAREMT